MLDAVGVIHFREGVLLYTEYENFVTAEACSGVRSLFSSIAGVYLGCLLYEYRWWATLLNLLQTLFWVVVGNALRVALIVYTTDLGTDFFASGIGHSILGFTIFAFILGMTFSGDRMARALFRKSRALLDESEEPVDEQAPASLSGQSSIQVVPTYFFVIAVLFLFVGIIGGRLLWIKSQNTASPIESYAMVSHPDLEQMPATIGEWKRVSFEYVDRGDSHLRAKDSFVWRYQNGETVVDISIDAPWDEWHNLEICYEGLGWSCQMNHSYSLVGDSGFSAVEMTRPGGERGYVLFSASDYLGNSVLPPEIIRATSVFQRAMKTIAISLGQSTSNSAEWQQVVLPVVQFQLYYVAPNADDQQLQKELKEFFVAARKHLLKTNLFPE